MLRRLIMLGFGLGIAAGCLAAESPQTDTEQKMSLAELLTPMLDQHRGVVTAAVKHLELGESFVREGDKPMPTASLIKLPLMVTAYQQVADGKLSLDDRCLLAKDDQVPGSGILTTHMSPGADISLRDAIELMIAYSDNTATNLVAQKTGLGATAAFMEKLGLPNTKLHSFVYKPETTIFPERSKQFGLGSTTANEMIKLLELIYANKIVDSKACEQMTGHLLRNEDREMTPRNLPADAKVAHKTGAVSTTRTDAGIIFTPKGPIAFAILTTGNADNSWTAANESHVLFGRFARTIYDYFNQPGEITGPPVARVLAMGADGDLVTALQRTLNTHLKGVFDVGVDGDFGPNTESGVKKFQERKKLPITGQVDAATWKALGPLVTQAEPVDAPDVVNAKLLEQNPADELTGPPIVACAAYAIADGRTGKLLFEQNGDVSREPASITKIMTALLVAKEAEKDPSVLEETLIASARAANTSGSTAELKPGDKVPVDELLYGLLLPSGNDASVALGEHFGAKLKAADAKSDPLELFIAAMNAQAQALGMQNTVYKNTHGLPAEGHVTTAADMTKLGFAAMQSPLLRKVVSTRQRGAQLDSIDGYQRRVLWKNSNVLLGIEGFNGVKTGTTGGAGACLVASGNRNDQPLIVVVLGAPQPNPATSTAATSSAGRGMNWNST